MRLAAQRQRRWTDLHRVTDFLVFYGCKSTGERVSEDAPVTTSRLGVCDLARSVLREPGDFLGLVDASERCVQFMVEDGSHVWMEMPDPGEQAVRGRVIHFIDLLDTIRALPASFESVALGLDQRRDW